ncbi:MAG: hypothetical protein WD044_04705 [Dongiaceae bacterium]
MQQAMQQVSAIVRDELALPVPALVRDLATQVMQRHGSGSAAVLFYGSCLRSGEAALSSPDSLLDFYLLVDDYRSAYPDRPWIARFNRLLPPNVFFVETIINGVPLRAKYAVISLAQFARGCGPRSKTSALWARFAQPARLVVTRDEAVGRAFEAACADAVETFVAASLPLVGDRFTAERLWETGFRATYGAELRSERGRDRAILIVAADRDRYEALTAATLGDAAFAHDVGFYRNPLDASARKAGRRAWIRRRVAGKSLNLLRLIKAVFTVDGAVDYALWKVERHAAVRPPVSPWERRHPILAAPILLWRFYRAGAFR